MSPSHPARSPNGLERCSEAINSKMEAFFGECGYWVAGRPKTVMFAALAFTVVSCLGFSHFVMISDPEDLFTPKEAEVIDDKKWDDWFWAQDKGIPQSGRKVKEATSSFESWLLEEGRTATRHEDDLAGADPSQVWGMAAYGFGIDALQEAHVYDNSHPANVLRRAIQGGAGADESADDDLGDAGQAWLSDRELEVAKWDGQDHPDTPYIDDVCHAQNFMFYKPPETATSVNMMDNNLEYVRFGIEAMQKIADKFPEYICWKNNRPYLSGIGKCWDWSLETFDADTDRSTTLKTCLKTHRDYEFRFMSDVEKNLNNGEIKSFTGYFLNTQWLLSPPEMVHIDDYFKKMGTDEVGVALISWTSINNAIYGALIHDMPYIAGPIFILMAYVGHVFYRKNNESHMSLAVAGIANVFMAVGAGIGLTLWTGTAFTAMHVCAVYITLGIGIDDAFIITAAVYDTEKEYGKYGETEIRRRVKQGMARCGPSILLTSLTDFCAFISNASSNIWAIRNFSKVAGTMVFIDYIFQITFFVSCLVLDMKRQEDNRYDLLCCFRRRRDIGGIKLTDDDGGAQRNRKVSDFEYTNSNGNGNLTRGERTTSTESFGSSGGSDGPGTPHRSNSTTPFFAPNSPKNSHLLPSPSNGTAPRSGFGGARGSSISSEGMESKGKKLSYSKKIMVKLSDTILHPWGKIAVLVLTAAAIMVGFYGSSKLSIIYTPFILIPSDSYVHESRKIMHDYFPWILEENWTCVQMKAKVDYSLHQKELNDLEDFACSQSSRDQCFAWYGLFRLYVSAKYSGDTSMYNTVFDDQGFLDPEHFYDELEAYSKDENMGGRTVTDMLVRFESKEQISGSQICFMWKREYNVPEEIKFMIDSRKMVRELAPVFDPGVFSKYFFSIEPLARIVPDTLRNFTFISTVVVLVCLLVLANVKATALVLISVMTIEIIVLGSLHFFDLQFNMMTSIMLIVGVGLCVDFSAHSAHAFLHSKERSGHAKARDALDTVGISIWNGAFSSVLAMLPMCLCKSYFVSTWWRVITLVITLGIYYGLCVVPVLLTLFDDEEGAAGGDFSDWTLLMPVEEGGIGEEENADERFMGQNCSRINGTGERQEEGGGIQLTELGKGRGDNPTG